MKKEIENWIQRINDNELIPSDIAALNFGLFESEDGYCIYLIGSKIYDEDDEDWACIEDFEPEEKYLEITTEDIRNLKWEEFQNSVLQIISDYIDSANENSLSQFSSRIITTGFDDGNLVRIR